MQGGDVAVAAAIELADAAHGKRVEVSYDATVRCDTCRGNGAEPGTPIVACPTCHGSGQTQKVARTRFGQLVRTAICDTCGGDGRIAETPCEHLRRARDGGRAGRRSRSTSRPGSPTASGSGSPAAATPASAAARTATSTWSCGSSEDERFLRDAEDLITVVDVAAPLAALGTTIQVPTLDGDLPVEIPAGTQPGETIVLRGRGMPPLGRGRTGDLRVVVNVAIPRRLTRRAARPAASSSRAR